MSEFIYIAIGFAFGCAFMLNRKEYRREQTFKQIDEELRKDHAMYKNLCASLKNDLVFAKRRIADLSKNNDK